MDRFRLPRYWSHAMALLSLMKSNYGLSYIGYNYSMTSRKHALIATDTTILFDLAEIQIFARIVHSHTQVIVHPLFCPVLTVNVIMLPMTKFVRFIYENSCFKNFGENIISLYRKLADSFPLDHVVPQINTQQWPHAPFQSLSVKMTLILTCTICSITLRH